MKRGTPLLLLEEVEADTELREAVKRIRDGLTRIEESLEVWGEGPRGLLAVEVTAIGKALFETTCMDELVALTMQVAMLSAKVKKELG